MRTGPEFLKKPGHMIFEKRFLKNDSWSVKQAIWNWTCKKNHFLKRVGKNFWKIPATRFLNNDFWSVKQAFLKNSSRKNRYLTYWAGRILTLALRLTFLATTLEALQGYRKFWVGRIFYYARNFYVQTSKSSTCIRFEKEVNSKMGLFFGKVKNN